MCICIQIAWQCQHFFCKPVSVILLVMSKMCRAPGNVSCICSVLHPAKFLFEQTLRPRQQFSVIQRRTILWEVNVLCRCRRLGLVPRSKARHSTTAPPPPRSGRYWNKKLEFTLKHEYRIQRSFKEVKYSQCFLIKFI